MAIKNIIAKGVGFSPGDTHFIVTHGFTAGAAPVPGVVTHSANWLSPTVSMWGIILFLVVWSKWPQ